EQGATPLAAIVSADEVMNKRFRHVRFGSFASVAAYPALVRSTPDSCRAERSREPAQWAKSGNTDKVKLLPRGHRVAVEMAATWSRHACEEARPSPEGVTDGRRSRRVPADRSPSRRHGQHSRIGVGSTAKGGITIESTDCCGPAVPRLKRARSRGYVRLRL